MSGLTSRIVKAPWIATAVATTLVGCVPAPEPSGLTCTPDAGLSGEGSAIAACPNFPWEGVPVPVDSPLNVVGGALLPEPAASPANEPLVWPEADPDRPNHLGAAGCGCDPVDLPNMAGDLLLGFNAVANGSPLRTFDGRPAIAWHDHRTAIGIQPLGCDPGRTVCGPPQPIGRFLRTARTNVSLSRVGQHPPAPVCVAQVGVREHFSGLRL